MNVQPQSFNALYPELGTEPVPTMPYVSPEYFELEREHIFKKCWLVVGRESEIPEKGDYVVKEIEVADASILIVRNAGGEIRAFHNVCSHRGGKVAWGASGKAAGFKCPYHAWVYGLDGRLRGVPAETKFFNFNRDDCGLTPVALDLWQGFMFINLAPQPEISLTDYLGDFATYAEGYPFQKDGGSMTVEFPILKCNWKVVLDAFQESYHLSSLHQQTLTGIFTNQQWPVGDPITIRAYGRHRSVSMWVNTEHKVGPVEAMAHRFVSNINSTSGNTASNAKTDLYEQAPGINPSRHPNWGVDVNGIFPNTAFLAMAGSYQIFQFWPLSVDSTRLVMTAYYDKPQTASQRFAREAGFAHTKGVVMEDIFNCEFTQKALKSRAKKFFHLQDGEGAIRHSYSVVESYVGPYVTDEMRNF